VYLRNKSETGHFSQGKRWKDKKREREMLRVTREKEEMAMGIAI